jgi:hypothetical protein
MGIRYASALQDATFSWTLDLKDTNGEKFPPVLVLVGEKDKAVSRRDFGGLVAALKGVNSKSGGMVLEGSWHNHPINVPKLFVDAIVDLVGKV